MLDDEELGGMEELPNIGIRARPEALDVGDHLQHIMKIIPCHGKILTLKGVLMDKSQAYL